MKPKTKNKTEIELLQDEFIAAHKIADRDRKEAVLKTSAKLVQAHLKILRKHRPK